MPWPSDMRAPSWMLRGWPHLVAVAVSFLGIGFFFYADVPGSSPWATTVGIVLFFGGITALIGLAGGVAHAHRVLERHNFQLCTRCNYDLSALPSPGTCPECGLEYEIEHIRKRWREYLEERKG